MIKRAAFVLTAASFAASVHAAPAPLTVTLKALDSQGRIEPMYAYCAPLPGAHTVNGGNQSPEIGWTRGPADTKSYAIIMLDPDVPTVFDNANKEDKTLPASMPRRVFVHWVLVDIAPELTRLPAAADSDRVEKAGKHEQTTKYGVRGINDYGATHFGYDGPCPPWNDERWHHYTFAVYALNIATLGLKGPFTAEEALKAMQGHILASGSAMGTYSQNPALIQGAVKK